MTRLSPADTAAMLEAVAKGVAPGAWAATKGVPQVTALQAFHRARAVRPIDTVRRETDGPDRDGPDWRGAIADDYRDGASMDDICTRYRISKERLQAILAEAGVALRHQGQRRELDAAQKAAVLRRYLSGLSIGETAKTEGVTEWAVRRAAMDAGCLRSPGISGQREAAAQRRGGKWGRQ